MTVEKLITDHIDIWSSALQTRSTAGRGSNGKIDLYGIKKLRELILELAVRGKLVPQDPNDEPASELLKRIAADKAELVKQGKIKKQKPLPEISEDEKPFELPVGWEWVTLATIGEIVGGGTPTSDNPHYWSTQGIKWLTPADLNGLKGKYISSGARDITIDGLSNSSAKLIPKGTVLFSSRAPIGYVAISNNELATNQGFKSCVPYIKESAEYIYYFLLSAAKKIDEMASGTTFKEVSGAVVSKVLLPFPPLNEQLKIVEVADDLMSLCDQLEQQSLSSLDAHQQLVETLLTTLADSQNAEELAENWARISQHFDTLFTTEASIDALKQTILQLAVMGKLVPQDPSDEPASELLKRIEQEKVQLVKEGKIKKQKPLPPVSDEEKPFALPVGWEWCRFEDVVDIQSGITKGRNLAGRTLISVPYLRVANVQRGYLQLSDIKSIEIPVEEKDKYHVQKGDLLITEGGDWDTVGRTAVWTDATFYVANQNHVFKARPLVNELNVKWLETFMNSSVSRDYFAGASKQTTNLASINKTQLRGCFIALPPISETNRILDQYISLLNVCDTLKSRLQSAQQMQLHLADALTDAALS
ncbi:restriction endonuclease subunit S [Enterobacter hormaechei]|uniref:restriction endonuclease subunit S n=1 Tax=Enterobacter hormaechei TaxID=158836 RepID=UPI000F82C375|nr:restriction endonuclease subunit S [Enterobacter hormaechei]MCU2307827.1 restriction endonuclease subunit S [Enterobacter hormaechei subsp. hormaechei]RTN95057.1 restriction endonuclease subunit S [Enterobacter hormaechei]RTP14294.1 restriction endonuclease subunit S [Enterobacter hormaechei]HEI8432626.1 restriction endonuclease subunit S [Enterobacter hormaechei]